MLNYKLKLMKKSNLKLALIKKLTDWQESFVMQLSNQSSNYVIIAC